MNRDDAQVLRDVRYFTGELLKDAGVLPAGLAGMLGDCERELYGAGVLSGRLEGIGDAGLPGSLAARIGQRLTDGERPPGARLDGSASLWYSRNHAEAGLGRALRLLAARGGLAVRSGACHVTGDPR